MSFKRMIAVFIFILAACTSGSHLSQSPDPGRDALVTAQSLQVNTVPPIEHRSAALRFAHYGLDDGLSQSSVLSLFQDRLGFLWIGTQDGLNRFDGHSFKVFSPKANDPDSLTGLEVFSMIEGVDGAIWIGSSGGLNRYDMETGKFSHWVHDDQDPTSLIDDVVQTIHQDSQGILWIGTRGGLDTFDPATEKFTHISLPMAGVQSGDAYFINALYEDQRGILWIGTNNGLIRHANGHSRLFQNVDRDGSSLSFNEVISISEDQKGNLWIGTRLGLNRLDPSAAQFTRFLHSNSDFDSLVDNYVQVTFVDRSGQLWIGTRNGLDRFDAEKQVFVHYQSDPVNPASLSDNNIVSIYEDRGGLLWVGTYGGGLNLHDRSLDQFAHYLHSNADPKSLSSNIIFPILPSDNGKIWIGTHGAGLNLFDPATGRSEHYRHDPENPDSLLSDIVLSIFLDPDGTLWIGTDQGLDRLDPGSSKFFHYVSNAQNPKSIPFGRIYKIFRDDQSVYWVGTSKGIRIFNPMTGEFTRIDSDSAAATDLANGPARVVYQDRSGAIWLGTDTHGLFRWDPTTKQLEQYENDPKVSTSISCDTVMDVYEDQHGRIWIATFGGGLNQYLPKDNVFVHFREDQGLPNDVVYGILEDQSGSLWLSTNLGISRFDPVMSTFENFTAQDGLQGNEFNSSAFAKDDQGRLYFGGMNGLTAFDPAEIKMDPYLPPVVLTSLTLPDGKPVSPVQPSEVLQNITLSYPQNSFDLGFAALGFSLADRNMYRYKLEGFDQDWHNAGSERRGSYTNLPGGSYTLHVQAGNSDGVWNEWGAALQVNVVPPFWQTWPFRVLTGMTLFVTVFLAYQWRIRGIQAQKIELERIIRERTQILKRQNLDLEALYSADEKMLRVLTQDEVLQALVDVAVDGLQADKSIVFAQAPNSSEFSVRVFRGFRAESVATALFVKSQQTLLSKVAAEEPLIIHDAVNHSEWGEGQSEMLNVMSTEDVRSLLYIPIKVQSAILGVLNVCSSEAGAFDEDRQRLFALLVQRAALSIENSRLFERTKNMAILDERNRLAQELHDSAKQKAFAALALLGAAKKHVMNGRGNATEHLAEAEKTVSEVIHELTFVIQASYPKGLKERGLAASVRDYAYTWESRTSIHLNLAILGEHRLPLGVEQVLYRIVQEALANIARHSKATQADVCIVYHEHEIRIQIGDNGKGFDLSNTSSGLGLQLIHERLESIGGHVDIQSMSGGTCLDIRVPIQALEEGAGYERTN